MLKPQELLSLAENSRLPKRFFTLPLQDNNIERLINYWNILLKQPLLPHDYVSLFTMTRLVNKQSSRSEFGRLVREVGKKFARWDKGFSRAIPELEIQDIIKTLENCNKFNLSPSRNSFQQIEEHIRAHGNSYSKQQIVSILTALTVNAWVPAPDVYTQIANDLVEYLPYLDVNQIGMAYRSAAIIEAIEGQENSTSRFIAQSFLDGFATMTPEQQQELARQAPAAYLAGLWFDNPFLLELADFFPRMNFDMAGFEDVFMSSLLRHVEDIDVVDPTLKKMGKNSDLAIRINGRILHMEMDGDPHFLRRDSRIFYDGRTIYLSALAAKLYPERSFIHLPYLEFIDGKPDFKSLHDTFTAHAHGTDFPQRPYILRRDQKNSYVLCGFRDSPLMPPISQKPPLPV